MNKYKIGKYIVDAKTPVQAMNIVRKLDSKVNDRVYANDVRHICIKNNWYTNGTVGQYDKMLIAANDNEWTLDEIAFDIATHSENATKQQVLNELRKIDIKDSVMNDYDSVKLANDLKVILGLLDSNVKYAKELLQDVIYKL